MSGGEKEENGGREYRGKVREWRAGWRGGRLIGEEVK